MACEMAALYKEKGITLLDRLEEIYIKYGYYLDALFNYKMDGAAGMDKIAQIMSSIRQSSKADMGGIKVKEMQDFGKGILGLMSEQGSNGLISALTRRCRSSIITQSPLRRHTVWLRGFSVYSFIIRPWMPILRSP